MKCHYEVLEVPRDADDSQIKAAYRKMALKWHPDKNIENSDYAKEQFQLIQQAYEVLSDKQERAWYDNHREQILRGSNSEFEDNSLDVFQYFTTTCFKGYSDDENSFYTVYRNVFDKIAQEDIEFMDDKEELLEIPTFGIASSDYEDIVGPFYAYWMSYSTKKSFVWLDPYDVKNMKGRRVFKLIEKENKQVRQKAKKERNDEIRALVAFVRKRDKRVQQYSKKLEAKIMENRKKQEDLSRQKRLERRSELNESNSQAEWSKFDNVKTELEKIEKHLAQEFGEEITDSEDEEKESEVSYTENLYCVACNKLFKTSKTFKNHESSKKHKENVERLKATLAEDDLLSDSQQEELTISEAEEIDDSGLTLSESEDEVIPKQKTKRKIKKLRNDHRLENVDVELIRNLIEDPIDDSKDSDFGATKKQKRKNKKSNSKADKALPKPSSEVNDNPQDPIEEEEKAKTKQKKTKKIKNRKEKNVEELSQADVDTAHCCVSCKADFPSKNKLFDHLKKTGHSVYLPQTLQQKVKKKTVKEK